MEIITVCEDFHFFFIFDNNILKISNDSLKSKDIFMVKVYRYLLYIFIISGGVILYDCEIQKASRCE